MAEPAAEQGWIARELADELPDLGLRYLTLAAEVAADRGVTRATTRIAIAVVQVRGVPEISVEEALGTVADLLSGER